MTNEQLFNKLPHGSGINGEWRIEERTSDFRTSNFYEPMNEAGFYDGIAHFTIIIPKAKPENFNLHFNGKHSQYYNKKYQLRDYIEDTIHEALTIDQM
tara:strand:- start:207 stop:500 length:294 start_codon:yes stop_codon:yes gene_type:complete